VIKHPFSAISLDVRVQSRGLSYRETSSARQVIGDCHRKSAANASAKVRIRMEPWSKGAKPVTSWWCGHHAGEEFSPVVEVLSRAGWKGAARWASR